MNVVGIHLEPGGVGWHRCWCWTTSLSEMGHDVWHKPHKETQFEWSDIDMIVNTADVVITGQTHNMEVFAGLWAGRDKYGYKLVVDCDDRVDIVPKYNPAFQEFHDGSGASRLMLAQLKIADLVTCTTPTLHEWALGRGLNSVYVPNAIDHRFWTNVKRREKPKHFANDFRIYWGGTAGRWNDLLLMKEPLLRVAKRHKNVKLIFSGFLPSWAVDLSMRQAFVIPFAKFNAYPKVASWLCADLAVAPLEDNEFNRAKSGIKYLYYGAARIPGIYQRINSYDIVNEGVTGLKASTAEEWEACIEDMMDDRDLRLSIAASAESDIWSTWEVGLWSKRYEAILQEVIDRRPVEVVPLTEGVPVEATIHA